MRETNASEPLMRHRNAHRRHQNRGHTTAPGSAWKSPTYWLCGVRCIGGVTLIPGFRTELETLVSDVKGKRTSGDPTRLKVPMRCSGSDRPILVTMRGNARGAKGVGHSRWDRRVNGKPEEPAGVSGRRQPSLSGTSRVTGDGQARFCEGLEVKLLGSTRQRCGQKAWQ